ncbi:MAG: DNA mismatch repair protein MutS, partial [bacterium]
MCQTRSQSGSSRPHDCGRAHGAQSARLQHFAPVGERGSRRSGYLVRLPEFGARLRHWILSPLRDPARIEARLDAVEALVTSSRGRGELRDALDGVRDIERLAARAAAGRANPRELGALRDS